jgi:hypothetical protein
LDVVQSKRKYLADSNDNIADQASKTSALLLAQSTNPIIKVQNQKVIYCCVNMHFQNGVAEK